MLSILKYCVGGNRVCALVNSALILKSWVECNGKGSLVRVCQMPLASSDKRVE